MSERIILKKKEDGKFEVLKESFNMEKTKKVLEFLLSPKNINTSKKFDKESINHNIFMMKVLKKYNKYSNNDDFFKDIDWKFVRDNIK